ncbi:CoA transferase [Dehalococcoidia bacterium]|nr:CoA transferase [Dehalococcoidia bacterium]
MKGRVTGIGRGEPPPFNEADGSRESGLYFYYNVSKKGVTLNPEAIEGRPVFLNLIQSADVLVEDHAPGWMDAVGLSFSELHKVNPRLVILSVTPFGQTGPWRDYQTYQLTGLHAGGEGWELTAGAERPPVMTGGDFSETTVGLTAAMGVIAALWRRRVSGKGNHIDMSHQEASMWPGRVELSAFPNAGVVERRRVAERSMTGVKSALDAWVEVTPFEQSMWQGLVAAMGSPPWADDPRFGQRVSRFQNQEEVNPRIDEWTSVRSAKEVYSSMQENGCPAFEVMTVDRLAQSDQYEARNYFTDMTGTGLGRFRMPSTPFTGEKPRYKAAPSLGENNFEIFLELGLSEEDLGRLKSIGVM